MLRTTGGTKEFNTSRATALFSRDSPRDELSLVIVPILKMEEMMATGKNQVIQMMTVIVHMMISRTMRSLPLIPMALHKISLGSQAIFVRKTKGAG